MKCYFKIYLISIPKEKKGLNFKDSVKTLVDTETSGCLWEEGWDLSVSLNAYFKMTYILFHQEVLFPSLPTVFLPIHPCMGAAHFSILTLSLYSLTSLLCW